MLRNYNKSYSKKDYQVSYPSSCEFCRCSNHCCLCEFFLIIAVFCHCEFCRCSYHCSSYHCCRCSYHCIVDILIIDVLIIYKCSYHCCLRYYTGHSNFAQILSVFISKLTSLKLFLKVTVTPKVLLISVSKST